MSNYSAGDAINVHLYDKDRKLIAVEVNVVIGNNNSGTDSSSTNNTTNPTTTNSTEAYIVSIPATYGSPNVGDKYIPPTFLNATMSDGATMTVFPEWGTIDTSKAGEQMINGGVNYKGVSYAANLYLTINPVTTVTYIEQQTQTIALYTNYQLPNTVVAHLSDGTTQNLNVTWNNIPSTSYAGTFTVNGIVKYNGNSTNCTYTLNVTATNGNTNNKNNGNNNNSNNNNLRHNNNEKLKQKYLDDLRRLKEKIENAKNQKNVQTVIKDKEGKWKWVYTYDQKVVDELQGEYDAEKGLYDELFK